MGSRNACTAPWRQSCPPYAKDILFNGPGILQHVKLCWTGPSTSPLVPSPISPFFSRHAPRNIGVPLPSVDGDEEEVEVAHKVIRDTHLRMSRRYWEIANRHRKNQTVVKGTLVWVKRETTLPGTCRKLNPRRDGPFKVVEVIKEGGAYLLQNLFTGQAVQRTAEKVKPYHGSDEWLTERKSQVSAPEMESEPIPPRLRRPPRR